MKRRSAWIGLLIGSAVALGMLGVSHTLAEESDAPPADTAPTSSSGEDTARQVMEQLLQQRQQGPTIEPTREAEVTPEPSRVGAPAAAVDLDPAVLGVAPGGEQPKLLPEGTFIVTRRGRLIRSSDGAHVLFVFEADDQASPEAPMILMPCRKLQDMEDYTEKHGDQTVFRLSGQVHTYRSANYLLPTMMVIDINRGNLTP